MKNVSLVFVMLLTGIKGWGSPLPVTPGKQHVVCATTWNEPSSPAKLRQYLQQRDAGNRIVLLDELIHRVHSAPTREKIIRSIQQLKQFAENLPYDSFSDRFLLLRAINTLNSVKFFSSAPLRADREWFARFTLRIQKDLLSNPDLIKRAILIDLQPDSARLSARAPFEIIVITPYRAFVSLLEKQPPASAEVEKLAIEGLLALTRTLIQAGLRLDSFYRRSPTSAPFPFLTEIRNILTKTADCSSREDVRTAAQTALAQIREETDLQQLADEEAVAKYIQKL